MNIYLRDEQNKIDDELFALMDKTVGIALNNEFGEDLADLNIKILEVPIDLSVSIVGGNEIKELNSEFRSIDRVTDVLSFPQYADNNELRQKVWDACHCIQEGEELLLSIMLGDVVICYEKAVEQAEEYGTGLRRELIYLFVHSIFHLMGYDHMNEEDKKVMRAKEELVMEAVGL